MSTITWEDPPPSARLRGPCPPGVQTQFVGTIKEQPGKWALYADDMAVESGSHFVRVYPGLEAAEASIPGKVGRVALYLRWVGES